MYGVALAGAIGFGTVGQLESAVTFSPLQLVIDNEIARYVRRAVRGMEVDEETLALDVIEETGINSHTYDHTHTVSQFRHVELLSPFLDCPSWGDGESLDRDRFEKRAAAKARELLAQESPPLLSSEQELAIDEVVKEAAMDLKVEVPV